MIRRRLPMRLGGVLFTLLPILAAAQDDTVTPAPPELPETLARGAEGRVTIRAVRLAEPLRIDGQLEGRFPTTLVSTRATFAGCRRSRTARWW